MSSVLEYCSSYIRSNKWTICKDTRTKPKNTDIIIYKDAIKFYFAIFFKFKNFLKDLNIIKPADVTNKEKKRDKKAYNLKLNLKFLVYQIYIFAEFYFQNQIYLFGQYHQDIL